MKKIKEFIKKIGNKKRCLLSLIIAGLLIFAVISGLNSPKSAVTEVNAIAPTTKNLDLNGVGYTYTTSLSELKNKYNLFNNDFSRQFCTIVSNTESENTLLLSAISNDSNSFDEFDRQNENVAETLNENLVFIDEKGVKSTYSNSFENNWNVESNQPRWDRPSYDFTKDNIGSLDDYVSLNINFVNLINDLELGAGLNANNYKKNIMVSFYYLNADRDYTNDNEEYLYNNSKRFNYVLSKPINDFNIDIKKIDGYDLKNIVISFENDTQSFPNGIYGRVLNTYEEFKPNGMTANGNIVINNVKFVKNNQANIITFYSDFTYNDSVKKEYFKGDLLLSREKYDHNFIEKIWAGEKNITGRVNLNGAGFFGGKFNDNFPTGSELVFKKIGAGNSVYSFFVLVETNVFNIDYVKNVFTSPNFHIFYYNQSRLLHIENISPLTGEISGDNNTYSALSAQVEDVLYNLNYVGNIEEEEFNQKVEKDLADLLKTTGLGAVIGLLGGFLVGNPVGGLIVGTAIGFFSSISPLLIDGLQAIFGKDFLSGLYNFFDKISEFFVGVFDGIVNFLMSIITNPFILILIVMIALLYIFVIRKN